MCIQNSDKEGFTHVQNIGRVCLNIFVLWLSKTTEVKSIETNAECNSIRYLIT